jgi:hypothetical protein
LSTTNDNSSGVGTMHRARLGLAMALGALTMTAGSAAAQTIQAGPLELDFTGRVQIQFNTTSVDEDDVGVGNDPATTAFETRRAYFGTAFSYEEWLTGLVQVNLAGSTPALADGYIDAALTDGFAVRAGQFKVPFGLIELTSNSKILTIERSVRIRGLEELVGVPGEEQYLLSESGYVGRQVGVMAHGTLGGLGYAAGVFNGEGANTREAEGSKGVAARLTWGLGEKLVVGGAVSSQPTAVFDVDGDEIRGTAWSLDAEYGEFRGPGLHVMAEAMYGDNPLLVVADETATMWGTQLVAAWFMPRDGRIEGLEPVLRFSFGEPDREVADDEAVLLTPGVNLYFTGRNRLMLNGEAYLPSAEALDPEYAMVVQMQIYF